MDEQSTNVVVNTYLVPPLKLFHKTRSNRTGSADGDESGRGGPGKDWFKLRPWRRDFRDDFGTPKHTSCCLEFLIQEVCQKSGAIGSENLKDKCSLSQFVHDLSSGALVFLS